MSLFIDTHTTLAINRLGSPYVQANIVGPLPVSKEGFRFLFTITDRSSRMLKVVPLVTVETTACRDTLIRNWICPFSVPAHITSDQGAQITSALMG